MKAPKILPWLAHRAGISDRRAELLWRAACVQAAANTGEHDGSRYLSEAQQRLLDLLNRERWHSQPALTWPWLLAQSALDGYFRLSSGWLAPLNAAVVAGQPWLPMVRARYRQSLHLQRQAVYCRATDFITALRESKAIKG